jgi:hypothetical protein
MYHTIDSVHIGRQIAIVKLWIENEFGQSLDSVWRIRGEISVERVKYGVEDREDLGRQRAGRNG